MDAINAVPLVLPVARAGTHQVTLTVAEAQLQEAWRRLRPQAASVNPGELLVPLRHGRTCYTLLDDSRSEPNANRDDERPLVVLINGLTLWSFCFKDLATSLMGSGMCKGVLMYDRYGRGMSDVAVSGTSDEPMKHTVDLFAQQLDDLLLTLRLRSGRPLKEEKLIIVGTSMGGLIATQFAAQCPPGLIQRLVLLAPCGLKVPPQLNSFDTKFLRLWGLGHAAYALVGEHSQVQLIEKDKFSNDVPNLAESNPKLLQDLTECVMWQLKCKPGYLWDFFRDLTQIAWGGLQREAEIVGQHTYGVELVWGTEDKVVPPSFADEWRRHIPRATVTAIEGAGHSPYLTADHLQQISRLILPS